MADCRRPESNPTAEHESHTHTATRAIADGQRAHPLARPAVCADGDRAAASDHDGYTTSHAYAARSEQLACRNGQSGLLDLEFHNPLENWLGRDALRRLLGYVSRPRRGRRTIIEDRFLRQHLPGYTGYAEQVPHRLLPGLW